MPVINKFGVSQGKSRSERSADVNGTVERILRRKGFLSLNEEGNFDAGDHRIVKMEDPIEKGDAATKNYVENTVERALNEYHGKRKRIANLELPIYDDDAATKKYVDASYYPGYSIMTFTLRIDLQKDPEWYIFRPFAETEYEFPFEANVKVGKTDLSPDKVEVFKGTTIIPTFFDGKFHFFFKGEKLRVHRIQEKNNAYLELIYRSSSENGNGTDGGGGRTRRRRETRNRKRAFQTGSP